MKLRRSSIAAMIIVLTVAALAQGQRGRYSSRRAPLYTDPTNSEFVLARWHYSAGWGGGGWEHDYPTAEEHILQVMTETTGLNTSHLSYRVVELSSPEIFKYPFAYVSEPGEMLLTDQEVENLREYVERGGFVMIDDFGGQRDQEEFQRFKPNMDRAFPDREMYQLTDRHPLLHNFFDVDGLLMVHPMEPTVKSEFYGFDDAKGRLAMVICFKNDVGDYWEFIDRPQYAVKPSAEALKLGINFVMYTMTH